MSEIVLQLELCNKLSQATKDTSILKTFKIENTTSEVKTLYDLIADCPYEIIREDEGRRWNPCPTFMTDVIGGMTPDVIMRSLRSGQNRIYIEVKDHYPLGRGVADSQVVRYFLHLLATSKQKPNKTITDIRRAILLAAPSYWFDRHSNAEKWGYFLKIYSELASTFDITIGEIRLD